MGYVIRSSDTVALSGIRQLVSINLTPTLLSDSVIDSPVFVRAAELHIYKLLGIDNDAAYDTKVGLSSTIRQFPRNQFPVTFNYRRSWLTNTQYSINDVVYDGSNLYYANKLIVNSSTIRNEADWNRINVDFKGAYTTGLNYQQYDIVYDGSNLYYANSIIITAPATRVSNDWTQIQSIFQTAAQRQSEERIKIAVQYQAAIRLILSMPQLLEEQILRERVRFQEIDWEKRIEFYEGEIVDTIEPEVPDGTIFADATAVFGEVKQRVAF